jgi:hypothetical protein
MGSCRKELGTYIGSFILNLNNWRGECFKPTSHARSNWSSYAIASVVSFLGDGTQGTSESVPQVKG